MTAFGPIQPVLPRTIRSSRSCSARWRAAAGRAPRTSQEGGRGSTRCVLLHVLKPAQRKVFDDWVAEQAAKTGTESMRDSFVAMLKSVGAKCKAPKPAPSSAAGAAQPKTSQE